MWSGLGSPTRSAIGLLTLAGWAVGAVPTLAQSSQDAFLATFAPQEPGQPVIAVQQQSGNVEVGLLGLPMRPVRGEKVWLSLVVEINGASLLLGDDSPDAVSAELFVHAFDGSGAVIDTATESLRFARGEAVDRLRATGAKVLTGMMVDPGTYQLRALVRNLATDREGSAQTEVVLDASTPILIPPIVPQMADPWIMVHGHRPEHAGAAPSRPYFVRDRSFVPAVSPMVRAGSNLPLVIMGYGLAGEEDELNASVFGPDGSELEGLNLVLSPAQSSRDGIDRILAALPIPGSVAAGSYTLQLHGFTEAPNGGVIREVGFEIGEGSPHPMISLAMPRPPAEAIVHHGAGREDEVVPKISVKEVAAAYRGLLARLDKADRRDLVTELAALELAGAGGDRESGSSRIKSAEMPLIRQIAKRDREALVPVLQVHHDVALEHRRLRHVHLMINAVATVRAVAELYAPPNGAIGNRIVVARVLSSLAGHFQASGAGFGRDLFQEALEYDPVHASALLGLAAYPEKRGGPYEEAVGYLERLVRAHPGNREGRLRLAINLMRSGIGTESDALRARAERRLERLVQAPEADWIYVLAVQELVRLLTTDDDIESAITLLEVATERVPENQKLKIMHAYCLDRVGRRTEAQRVMVSIEPDRTGMEPARGRYNKYPRQALAIDRRLLDEGVERRRALLVRLASKPEER